MLLGILFSIELFDTHSACRSIGPKKIISSIIIITEQRAESDVHRATCRERCLVHVALCTLPSARGLTLLLTRTQCYIHVPLCTLPSARCPKDVALCTLPSARCSLHVALCTLRFARCCLHVAPCTLLFARCPLRVALCALFLARCSLRFRALLSAPCAIAVPVLLHAYLLSISMRKCVSSSFAPNTYQESPLVMHSIRRHFGLQLAC